MTTIRDRVKAVAVELRDEDVPPSRARELLMELTGLLANVNREVTEATVEYAAVLSACYRTEETANRAKIEAETTPQFARKLEAKDTQVLVTKMIGACRAVLNSLDSEMRLSR